MKSAYNRKEMIGVRFNRLVAIEYLYTKKKLAYYKFKCDCGNEKISPGSWVRNGHTKSCGCLKKEAIIDYLIDGRTKRTRPLGCAAFSELYTNYKRNARKRKLEFNLNEEQFKILTTGNCYYCKEIPKQIIQKNHNGAYVYNGIDRLNNNMGYTIENCVSCCGNCNKMKMSLNKQEFLNKIKRIYENLQLGKIL